MSRTIDRVTKALFYLGAGLVLAVCAVSLVFACAVAAEVFLHDPMMGLGLGCVFVGVLIFMPAVIARFGA